MASISFMDSSLLQQPLSPIAQYLSSPMLNISILAILEFQVPIHTLDLPSNLRRLFLPINPRFSSILVTNEKGEKKWERVRVDVEEHVKDPIFPTGLTTESYKAHFDEYLTKISMEEFRPDKPLWEAHLFKYRTSASAAGTMILKLHHSLGDGYSLMGVVLSCLQTASDPTMPLTFPSQRRQVGGGGGVLKSLHRLVSAVCRTASDLGWGVLKGGDEKTPIRSGREGVEFMPMTTLTVSFSLEDIKQIKAKLKVTVNDVITGIIFMGLRLYMEEKEKNSGQAGATVLTIVNTRVVGTYRAATEMAKPESKGLWGNQLSYLEIMVPNAEFSNPLQFVTAAHHSINNKRTSFTLHVVAHLLNLLRKLRGHQEVAKFLHNLMRNTTTMISNVIGPLQQMALDNHPISGLYFTIVGTPQSVTVTVFSYMGNLRVAFRTEKDFIDAHKLNSCMEDAFNKIFKAANDVSAT